LKAGVRRLSAHHGGSGMGARAVLPLQGAKPLAGKAPSHLVASASKSGDPAVVFAPVHEFARRGHDRGLGLLCGSAQKAREACAVLVGAVSHCVHRPSDSACPLGTRIPRVFLTPST
jgi:hypothetical protein